ncbi:hypothetical protein GCM10027562_36930 [Arthrobacter pigmenti]
MIRPKSLPDQSPRRAARKLSPTTERQRRETASPGGGVSRGRNTWVGSHSNHTLLMGASTYRVMSGMSDQAMAGADFTADEAASLTGLPVVSKVVFSLDPPCTVGPAQHRHAGLKELAESRT